MADPLETSELLAFARTVESKSLSRAAVDLRVPRATISRRLARLERRLAVRLLRRTTRSLVLTDAGEALYRHARIVLDAVGHAEASVRRTDQVICGDLRVSVPPMMNEVFYEMLTSFAEAHPQVRLQVHFSTQLVDLQRGEYDVALRASSDLAPGLIGRQLARNLSIAVAAPAYLSRKGVPRTPRDLRNHDCLMNFARGEVPQSHWPLHGGGKHQVSGTLFSNDVFLLMHAARRGRGITLLPALLVRRFLETGELVHVLPGTIEGETRVALVYADREFVPPQVRAFIEAVVAWAPSQFDDLRQVTGRQPARTRPKRAR
jgi:DNA-binding transcriptional LysR family regulator